MSLAYEEPAFNPDPIWERALVLSELNEAYRRDIGRAAIHIHDGTDNDKGIEAIAVLAGVVEPRSYQSNSEDSAGYAEQELILLMHAGLWSPQPYSALFMAGPKPRYLARYNFLPGPDVELDRQTAIQDATVRDKLARTSFDWQRSEQARDRLIGLKVLQPYRRLYP